MNSAGKIEELVETARKLVPRLEERASATEKARRIPDETLRDFVESGLLRASQPQAYGGLGLPYTALLEVAMELASGCASAGWCYSIWAGHNFFAGMYPKPGQDEYWQGSADVISVTSFNPVGATAVPEKDGYRVSGRWDFASGSDHATWALVAGIGPEGMMQFMIPVADFRVDDTWFVSGLRGSGSKDVVVEDAFVPAHRVVSMAEVTEGRTPGRDIHDDPGYRIPLMSIFPFTLLAPAIGAARGALRAFESSTRAKVASPRATPSQIAALSERLGTSWAEVDAAQRTLRMRMHEAYARAERLEVPDRATRLACRRDHAFAAKLCRRSVDRLFEAAGGHALFDGQPLQRFQRDVHAITNHIALVFDAPVTDFGRSQLGLDPDGDLF